MKKVLITGMGVISAIGENLSENHQSLRAGKTGISRAAHFESHYAALLPFGECGITNSGLREYLGLENAAGYTRTCLLAAKAFSEAVLDAGLTREQISDERTAFISASTVGGMCLTDQLYEDANMKSSGSEYLEAYACSSHALKLIDHYQIKGFTDTINTACSSSANAIMLGARLIRSGRADRAIVGGVDSLAKYTVNGFNALKILAEDVCKPFDENRNGLNLGEGAGYLVLEADHLVHRKKVYGAVAGYGNSNDAFHPSAMSDDATGAIRCMREAIELAGINANAIGYINAHGTGTRNNDEVEALGLSSIFESVPPFNSTKSYTGHTLGAAGAIEAIFSVLSIYNAEIYPSLHIDHAIKAGSSEPNMNFQADNQLEYVLSNSFGFGGNCTSLVFAKVGQVQK